jgi:hypothetical protein
VELLIACVMLVVTPLVALLSGLFSLAGDWGLDGTGELHVLSSLLPAWVLVLGLVIPDLALSILAAIVTRHRGFLLYAPVFPFLRMLDAVLTLVALRRALVGSSSGVWQSPQRRATVAGG